jgi:hypothetical protein
VPIRQSPIIARADIDWPTVVDGPTIVDWTAIVDGTAIELAAVDSAAPAVVNAPPATIIILDALRVGQAIDLGAIIRLAPVFLPWSRFGLLDRQGGRFRFIRCGSQHCGGRRDSEQASYERSTIHHNPPLTMTVAPTSMLRPL